MISFKCSARAEFTFDHGSDHSQQVQICTRHSRLLSDLHLHHKLHTRMELNTIPMFVAFVDQCGMTSRAHSLIRITKPSALFYRSVIALIMFSPSCEHAQSARRAVIRYPGRPFLVDSIWSTTCTDCVNMVAPMPSRASVCQSWQEPPTAISPPTICGSSLTAPISSRKESSYARNLCANFRYRELVSDHRSEHQQ